MFYSSQILARKGPLGIVWIAAHVDGQLKRSQIFDMSIPGTVEALLSPEAPLALRLTGQLLLGVVRIYARKVAYLHQDCNDALVKIRLAFRTSQLELAPEHATAPAAAITLADDAMGDLALLLGGAGPSQGGFGSGGLDGFGPCYSVGLTGPVASAGGELSGMLEIEVDILGLGSQGDALLRQPSLKRKLSTRLSEMGTQRQGLTQPRTLQQLQQQQQQQRPQVLFGDEEEMFGDPNEEFPHDLDDIEVEQLRAAPSVQGPDRTAGDVMAGMKALSEASGQPPGSVLRSQGPAGSDAVSDRGGRELGAAGSASLGSPELAGDRPVGLRTVVRERMPLNATPAESSGAEGGLEFEPWGSVGSKHGAGSNPGSAVGRGPQHQASGSRPDSLALLLLPETEGMDVDVDVPQLQLSPVAAAAAPGAASPQQQGQEPSSQAQQEEQAGDTQLQGGAAGLQEAAPAAHQPMSPAAHHPESPAAHHPVSPAAHQSEPPADYQPASPGAPQGPPQPTLTPLTLAPLPAPAPAPAPGAALPPPAPRLRAAPKSLLARHPATVDPRGSAGTLLSAKEMRELLNDRAPLLRPRAPLQQQQRRRQQQQQQQALAPGSLASRMGAEMLSAAATNIGLGGMLARGAGEEGQQRRARGGSAGGAYLCSPLLLLVQGAAGRLDARAALEAAAAGHLAAGLQGGLEAAEQLPAPARVPSSASPAARLGSGGVSSAGEGGGGGDAAAWSAGPSIGAAAGSQPGSAVGLGVAGSGGPGGLGPEGGSGPPSAGGRVLLPALGPEALVAGAQLRGQDEEGGPGVSQEGSNKGSQGGPSDFDSNKENQGAGVNLSKGGRAGVLGGLEDEAAEFGGSPPLRKRQRFAVEPTAAVGGLGRSPLLGAGVSPLVAQGGSARQSGASAQYVAPGSARRLSQAQALVDEELMRPDGPGMEWERGSQGEHEEQLAQAPEQGLRRSTRSRLGGKGPDSQQLAGSGTGAHGGGQGQESQQQAGSRMEADGGGQGPDSQQLEGQAGSRTEGPGGGSQQGPASQQGASGMALPPLSPGAGMASPLPGSAMAMAPSPGCSDGLGLGSARKAALQWTQPPLPYGRPPASSAFGSSGDEDSERRRRSMSGVLTQGAGSVLDKVSRAALAQLPEGFISLALSQEAGMDGGLSQEAATQLTQPQLSMEQLTQGSSRVQACRWFSELLLLKSRGLVQLQQRAAYDDVAVGLTEAGVAETASQLLTTMLSQQ